MKRCPRTPRPTGCDSWPPNSISTTSRRVRPPPRRPGRRAARSPTCSRSPAARRASPSPRSSTVDPSSGERVVLKVAPPGLEPVRNRDVARQARLMRALAGAPGVRVPTVYFEDDGAPPEVSPFHAMNIVPGECLEPILAAPPADVLPLVPDRAFGAAADARGAAPGRSRRGRARRREAHIARGRDQALDPRLRDRRRADERALPRSRGAAVRHHAARAPRRDLPRRLPPRQHAVRRRRRSRALIDWEIWSLSDPRLDLAWFLFFTDEAKHPMASNPGPTGMPTAGALLDAYVGESGAEPANLEWFHCLIRYKEAAATALLMKRLVKAGGDAGNAWETDPRPHRRVHRPPPASPPPIQVASLRRTPGDAALGGDAAPS